MVPFAGWEMPLSYAGQLAEHTATRTAVGIFDVSHMGQVRLHGPRVVEYLQHLVPNDYATLAVGAARYTQLCNPAGGVIDDLIIARIAPNEFFAVVNAANRARDVEWMRAQAGDGVVIDDESDRWAMLAIQGPGAPAMIDAVLGTGAWSGAPAFTMHACRGGYLSRTGYTGETGGEWICPADEAADWWRRFRAAGAVPCGLAARDSLRLEAGYCLHGNDLDPTISPVEAGLGWSIAWRKAERWIGRDVHEAQRAAGPSRLLVPVVSTTRQPMRRGQIVVANDAEVGVVTSGGYSPGLQRGIGLAMVATSALGGAIALRGASAPIPIERTRAPFVSTSLKPR